MKLDPETYDEYWSKGWCVVEEVFPLDQVDRVAARAVELAQEQLTPESGTGTADRDETGKVVGPRKLNRPFEYEALFRDFVLRGPLPSLIEQIIGKAPLLCTDQIFLKPPHHGSPKAYHQDNAYFCCDPGDEVITAWIAMDDVDETNGCLRYIDGSHRGPILESRPIAGREHDLTPNPELIDLSKESLARVHKGGVVFHHSVALHCSGENRSNRWRRGYATHWVTADTTCANNTLDIAYYRVSDHYPKELLAR